MCHNKCMREKLETLSVTQLREIAKSQNIKYVMKLKRQN